MDPDAFKILVEQARKAQQKGGDELALAYQRLGNYVFREGDLEDVEMAIESYNKALELKGISHMVRIGILFDAVDKLEAIDNFNEADKYLDEIMTMIHNGE